MTAWYRREGQNGVLVLRLHVQPGARATRILGVYADALKLQLAAPPLEGRANACLVDFLSECFGVPKARIVLRQGAHGRRKVVEVRDSKASPEQLWREA